MYGQIGKKSLHPHNRNNPTTTLHVGGVSEEGDAVLLKAKFELFGAVGECKIFWNKNIGYFNS